jgi:hypothetical protein
MLYSQRIHRTRSASHEDQVKLWPLLGTLVVWSTITAVSAYSYAVSRMTSVDAIPGYETTWRFQLLAFAIFRFPLFLGGLALARWFGRTLLLKSEKSPR